MATRESCCGLRECAGCAGTPDQMQMAIMVEKTEMNTSDNNGSIMWSEKTYWDTRLECEG